MRVLLAENSLELFSRSLVVRVQCRHLRSVVSEDGNAFSGLLLKLVRQRDQLVSTRWICNGLADLRLIGLHLGPLPLLGRWVFRGTPGECGQHKNQGACYS